MAFTVVPLHNLTLDVGTSAEFGAGFVLQDVPQWLRDEPILTDLGIGMIARVCLGRNTCVSRGI